MATGWRRAAAGSFAAALVLVAGACGGDDDDAGSDVTSPTTASTVVTTTTTPAAQDPTTTTTAPQTVVTIDEEADELADGEHFGFASTPQVNDTTATMNFDLAQMLTGDDAVAAAEADGVEEVGDFYIRNLLDTTIEVQLAPRAPVFIIPVDDCCDPVEVDVPTFAADYVERVVPVRITVEDGIVVRVEEQYLP